MYCFFLSESIYNEKRRGRSENDSATVGFGCIATVIFVVQCRCINRKFMVISCIGVVVGLVAEALIIFIYTFKPVDKLP